MKLCTSHVCFIDFYFQYLIFKVIGIKLECHLGKHFMNGKVA